MQFWVALRVTKWSPVLCCLLIVTYIICPSRLSCLGQEGANLLTEQQTEEIGLQSHSCAFFWPCQTQTQTLLLNRKLEETHSHYPLIINKVFNWALNVSLLDCTTIRLDSQSCKLKIETHSRAQSHYLYLHVNKQTCLSP